MTPNDTQMDVLMRRYAKRATETSIDTEHLDPDELNAFAQATLPPAARSRYVSHLADCNDCRKLASELTIAAGAKPEFLTPSTDPIAEVSWWQKMKVILAPASLRYAAFALVLIAAVGITFVVLQQPRPRTSEMVARNEPVEAPAEALRRSEADTANKDSARTYDVESRPVAQPTTELRVDKKEFDLSPPAPPAKAASEPATTETKSGVTDNKTTETTRGTVSPSYAPPPAAEDDRAQPRAREQQRIAGAIPGGPRRNESLEKYKAIDRSRAGETPKDSDEGSGRATNNQPVLAAAKQEESGPRKLSRAPSVQSNTTTEMRVETRKPDTSVRDGADEAPQTRSVGGRKFQQRGNAWVDVKFKSSMSVRNISRGSDDYDDLDSGLRSIAQQLSGEIVVVWKGKAYRIR